jgi:hypothetical protein
MNRLLIPLTFLFSASLACGALGSDPTTDPAIQQTQIAQSVAATLAASNPTGSTAAVSAPVIATQSGPLTLPTAVAPTAPPTLAPTQRPLPTAFTPLSAVNPNPSPVYALQTELPFGDYVVRHWHDTASAGFGYNDIVILAASDEPAIQIENVVQLNEVTGMDVNGDGFPDVIIDTYTGGAHCCSAMIVYTMQGNLAREILHSVESNCGGKLVDLNGDGVLEFDTCDDSFAYTYCSYAASPVVRVIYVYDPVAGRYIPASPRFASLYTETIAADTQAAQAATPGDRGEWDGTAKCSVLPVVLDYLYSGQTDKAWSEFNRLYPYPDAATWRTEIETIVFASPRYAAP